MKLWLFILVFLSATQVIEHKQNTLFVIWNIGQGQWTTAIQENKCLHFDLGGEKRPLSFIKNPCGQKENHLYLSHWDMDHIGFMKIARTLMRNSCMSVIPRGKTSPHKENLISQIKKCTERDTDVTEIKTRENTPDSNSSSHVQVYDNKILIPGDSPITEEKYWAQYARKLPIQILILGHHGSRTSTGDYLLKQLPRLKLAIASSRYARYRHPHAETLQRLRKNKTPVILTEDWGHIGIEI